MKTSDYDAYDELQRAISAKDKAWENMIGADNKVADATLRARLALIAWTKAVDAYERILAALEAV